MKLFELQKNSTGYWKLTIIGFIGLFIFFQFFDVSIKPRFSFERTNVVQSQYSSDLEKIVLPSQGVILPVQWGNLGKRMVESGVIDGDKFEAIYAQRGGLDEEAKKLLYGENNEFLKIDAKNSGIILNLLWAFGLSNKNSILDEGPIWDDRYGGDASRFASIGGWTLAKGDTMDHYSKYLFVVLTPAQQDLVERVSKNIYRPCCGNSAYFPDCNHGMAMLGLLELLAAQGINEGEMYKIALQVNSYWFPSTYITLAKYFSERGVAWGSVNAEEVLGVTYSSALGYQNILVEIAPVQVTGGGSCGV